MVTSISGTKLKYRYAKFSYSKDVGHHIVKPYGKTYTVKLTKSTKYYKSVPWPQLSSLKAYRYSYHSKAFKKLKILTFDTYYQNTAFYIRVSKGKVKTVISPVVFAI